MKILKSNQFLSGLLILFFFILSLESWAHFFPEWTPLWSQNRQTIAEESLRYINPRTPNPDLGWVLLPNKMKETSQLGNENIGVRDYPIENETPWGIALGDSFTEGLKVDLNSTWPKQLEKKSGKRILNLGQSGYTTNQYAGLYLKSDHYFKPKIILVGIYENDFSERVLIKSKSDLRARSQNILRNKIFVKMIGAWLMKNSYTYRLVRSPDIILRDALLKKIGENKNGYKTDIFRYQKQQIQLAMQPRIEDHKIITTNTETPEWAEAVHLISDDLKIINVIAHSNSSKLLILYFPSKEQTYIHLLKEKYKVSVKIDAPNHTIEKICRQHAIPFLDLTKPFRQEAKKDKQLYFYMDGHWNEQGHKLAAEIIYQWFDKNDWL